MARKVALAGRSAGRTVVGLGQPMAGCQILNNRSQSSIIHYQLQGPAFRSSPALVCLPSG
jgi:hypothetical protein